MILVNFSVSCYFRATYKIMIMTSYTQLSESELTALR